MKPANVLFIISDEHRRDALGCYGHPLVKTPHLDRLAARGVRFQSAYTNCPICVPARASLATGNYVHEIGYWDNAHPYEGRVRGWGHRLIDDGHRVDVVGKLHYRDEKDDDGFTNKYMPLNVVDGIGDVLASIRDEPPIRSGTREGITTAGPGESTYLDYDSRIADRSADWLREAAQQPTDKPWVLMSSFVCPHPPFVAPQELYDLYPLDQIPLPPQYGMDERPSHPTLDCFRKTLQYDRPFTDEEVRRVTAAYYGACTHLDQQIGKLLDVLDETGLAENTRIIYTSDHGENMGTRGLWGKFTMYEESAGVPFIMAGPDVPQGEVCDDLVSLVDLYPTIVEGVGQSLTDEEKQKPGDSLWSVAQGDTLGRPAFCEYHAVGCRGALYMFREGNYKYVHYIDGPPQLFDLDADPNELNNLAESAEHQAVLADLHSKLCDMIDPDDVDRQAKDAQETLINKYGGKEAVLQRGTFVNSPVPGEKVSIRQPNE
jgi:choline-sulfatase